jgi:acetoin utilization protein AcuB
MKISEVMRRGPFTITESDSLGVAQYAMSRARIRHLPVVSDGRLVGILSERDVLAARAHADDRDWWAIRVHDAMRPAQTAHPEDSLTEVAARMASGKLGAMPIVERGKLLGIATITDVLDAEVRVAMGPTPVQQLTAADVMTPYPAIVRPELALSRAVAVMIEHRVRHLPVVDETSAIVGMLSDRDLRAAIGDPARYLGLHPENTPSVLEVRDVMTRPAIAIPFDTPLVEVARRFTDARIGALPVTDKFGALIGIVSYVDALRVLAQ